jgi:hypothetical protein
LILNSTNEGVALKTNILLLISALFLFVGCAKTNSDNVKTSGIYATYRVVGNNQNSATCTVQFQVGGATGTFLNLSSGDTVTCDGQSMVRSEIAGIITYSASVAYQAGKAYNVDFSRPNEGTYTSTVVLPSEINGISVAQNSSFQKGTAITPTWTASGNFLESMLVELNYCTTANSNCYRYQKNDTAPEAGSGIGFSSNETQVTPNVAGTWNGSLTFRRYLNGSMDASLSGSIQAEQKRTIDILLND